MRRTVLSAVALTFTAVLAGTAPAFADGPSPVPSRAADTTEQPSAAPSKAPSTEAPSQAPSQAPGPAQSARPARPAPQDRGQVSVVPRGAPNTGAVAANGGSGSEGSLIGGGAAAAALGLGGAVFLVRRKRATGA